jgi:hypothetical protein
MHIMYAIVSTNVVEQHHFYAVPALGNKIQCGNDTYTLIQKNLVMAQICEELNYSRYRSQF